VPTTLLAVPRTFPRAAAYALALATGAALATLTPAVAGAKSHATTTTTTSATTTTGPSVTAADTWLIRAIGAEEKVGSVRVTAVETKGKDRQTISLLVNGDGEGSGTFTQGGGTTNMKLVGALIYIEAPYSYWKAHSTAEQAKAFGGKWIEVSALDTRFEAFDEFFNPEELTQAVFEGHANPLTLSKPKATLMGHKVVVVSEVVKDSKGRKSSGQMYIAATGNPVALRIIDKSPGMTTTITFSHYGKAVSINIPPEPINLTQSS
jgi:hypothetical protein